MSSLCVRHGSYSPSLLLLFLLLIFTSSSGMTLFLILAFFVKLQVSFLLFARSFLSRSPSTVFTSFLLILLAITCFPFRYLPYSLFSSFFHPSLKSCSCFHSSYFALIDCPLLFIPLSITMFFHILVLSFSLFIQSCFSSFSLDLIVHLFFSPFSVLHPFVIIFQTLS